MNDIAEHTLTRPTPNPAAGSGPRTVVDVYRSTPRHWVGDGFHVSTYFPRPGLSAERVSPFLLMDYGPPEDFTALARGKRGVGWHPHRGFETVTLAWEGAVAHRDNAGHSGIIGPGDVQWMTAAGGILHEEYHAPEFIRRGGRMHMMQLWVNLPRRHKMDPPGYQGIASEKIPVVTLPGDGGTVRVVAGDYAGAQGPAHTFSPITLLDANVRAGARLSVPLPPRHNALAIVTSGRVHAEGRVATAGELMVFANDGASLDLHADEDTHVLILAGEPLHEPIVQYGPFVMNTPDEIHQAMVDFDAGKFGAVPA